MMFKARASTETMSGGGIESAKAEAEAEARVGKDAESVEMMTTRAVATATEVVIGIKTEKKGEEIREEEMMTLGGGAEVEDARAKTAGTGIMGGDAETVGTGTAETEIGEERVIVAIDDHLLLLSYSPITFNLTWPVQT
jgi:hypothetical protein